LRILIYGAGSVGGFLAAHLARAGRDVAVLARGEHLAAIQRSGLTMEMPAETFTVPVEASDDPAAIGPVDIVLVTLKTTANAAVARRIAPLLHESTEVVFAQNGIFWWYGHGFDPEVPFDTSRLDPLGRIAAAIPPARAMGLVIYSPNEVVAPGRIRCTMQDSHFHLGAATARPDAVAAVAAALSGAGFRVETPADIRHAMWKKLLLNLATAPLCALTRATGSGLDDVPGTEDVACGLVRDGMAVAAAHGFADLGVDPVALTRPGSRGGFKPSMLQDLERGRPMEIDTMLAIVQDFAREADVPTPTLDIVLPLLTLLARTHGLYPPPD
jgi:2-dehydropantoate 2-reductase